MHARARVKGFLAKTCDGPQKGAKEQQESMGNSMASTTRGPKAQGPFTGSRGPTGGRWAGPRAAKRTPNGFKGLKGPKRLQLDGAGASIEQAR